MVVLVCAMHFGLERPSVCEEFGVEDYEEFGIQLRMRVKICLRVLLILVRSTNLEGVVVPGDTGPRLMTSLQALSIYSLFTTSLNVGSAFLYVGKVRTILE